MFENGKIVKIQISGQSTSVSPYTLTEDKNTFNLSHLIPSAPKVQMTGVYYSELFVNEKFLFFKDTIAWLQGISHIFINSTVESRIPVHVAWYFRYYQVGREYPEGLFSDSDMGQLF